jgi:hypothetical protein
MGIQRDHASWAETNPLAGAGMLIKHVRLATATALASFVAYAFVGFFSGVKIIPATWPGNPWLSGWRGLVVDYIGFSVALTILFSVIDRHAKRDRISN